MIQLWTYGNGPIGIAFFLLLTATIGQGAPSRAQFRTVKVGHLDRTFWLHVPLNDSKDKPTSLVFVFHGGGGQGKGMISGSGFTDLADKKGFIVVYPDGVGRNWNDGRDIKQARAQRDNVDDVAFVSAMIDSLSKEFTIDPKRIYATGISNGAFMSERLGAELSERFAAIAPVAGGMALPIAEKLNPKEPVSVILLNGTDDPLVPFKGGEVGFAGGRGETIGVEKIIQKWVARDQCPTPPQVEMLPDADPKDGTRVERTIYTGGQKGTEVALYKIEGGGHTWPGGSQYLPKAVVGRVCRDLDGPAVIWEFFKKHPKP